MSSTVAWLASTVASWIICSLAYVVIEALVDHYWSRIAVMIVAGGAVGALASAFGYTIFILALILLAQLVVMHRKLLRAISDEKVRASIFVTPSIALVVAATLASHVFSIEVCDGVSSCHRVFFERIYTPPHLVTPDHGA